MDRRITITIALDNAAFNDEGRHEPGPELARILRRLADDLEDDNDPAVLLDVNGNAVGRVEWTGGR